MLTDDDARALLHAAGVTIDVDPAGPLDVTRAPRPRWPLLAVAAAVLLVVGTLSVVLPREVPMNEPASRDDDASPAPFVPSVLGLRTEEARQLLESRGYVVGVDDHFPSGCGVAQGDAVRTRPNTGTALAPGKHVSLVVAGPGVADCLTSRFRGLAAALLRFSRVGEVESPLTFAPTVRIVSTLGTTELASDEVADPGRWQVCRAGECSAPLEVLIDRADHPLNNPGAPQEFAEPVAWKLLGGRCGPDLPGAPPGGRRRAAPHQRRVPLRRDRRLSRRRGARRGGSGHR